jgi:iron complex outermembrane recepter protein
MGHYSSVSLIAIVAALGLAAPAWAQTDEGGTTVEELVVTAQKRTERLVDAPQTVNVVTGGQIESLGLNQFEDVAKVTPGLDITSGDGRQQAVSLRGIKFDQDTGTARTVDIYLNEVPVDPVQALQNQYDIGQIEVLRGPQGTLRGGTGPSGAVLIGTRRPDLDDISGSLIASYSDIESTNIQAAIGVPIIPGKLAVRVAALYDRNDSGQAYSVVSGQEDYSRTRSYRASVLWTPTDALNVQLMHQDLGSESRRLFTVAGAGVWGVFSPESRVSVTDGGNDFETDGAITTLNATYDFAGHRLSYVGGYQDNSFVYERDLDIGNALPGQSFQSIDIATKEDTHELRIERTGDHFWLYRFGYFQSETETAFDVVIDYTGGNGTCGGPLSFLPCFTLGGGAPSKTQNRGYFTTQTFKLTENDTLDVGLRYSISGSGIGKEHATTGTLSYKHRFNEDLMAYFSYGRGFRPGGEDTVSAGTGAPSGIPASEFNWVAEESDSYEVGLKTSLFDNRMQVALSVYHQDFKNYIGRVNALACTGNITTGVGPIPGTVYATVDGQAPNGTNVCSTVNNTYNADVIARGVELDVRARIMDGWSAQFTASYSDAHFDDALIPCNDFNGDGAPDDEGIATVQAGRYFSRCRSSAQVSSLPRWQVSANSEYSWNVGDSTKAFVRGLATYRPSSTDPNDGDVFQSAFRADLFAGFRFDAYDAEVSLFARNVFDDVNYDIGEEIFGLFGNNTGYRSVFSERGREIGLRVRYNFGA